MNDEANTHIMAIIAQMVEGHEWLKKNVQYVPRYGWAIDPFGLSPTMAYVSKQMGLKGMVVQRAHYAVKKYLAQNQMLEFKWRQFWETGDEGDIIAHVMPFFSYDAPHSCGPDPKVCCQFDFRRLQPYKMKCPWNENPREIDDNNVKERAALLADQYWKKAMLFKSNSILVPLGEYH
jgi:alpha-mannosidase II